MYGFTFIPDINKSNYDINTLLKVKTAPIIEIPKEIVEQMKMGDGTTEYVHTGIYEDREIKLECNYVEENKRAWTDKATMINRYFGNRKGILRLMSDDQEHYYKVKNVKIDISKRNKGIGCELSIAFICDPYRYLNEFLEPVMIDTDKTHTFINAYEDCCPLYRIENMSPEAEELIIMNNKRRMVIHNPFSFVRITSGVEEQYDIDYIEIDTENEFLKRVGKGANLETGYRVTYDTVKTEGLFDNLKFKTGENKIESTIDKGAVTLQIMRNYREI